MVCCRQPAIFLHICFSISSYLNYFLLPAHSDFCVLYIVFIFNGVLGCLGVCILLLNFGRSPRQISIEVENRATNQSGVELFHSHVYRHTHPSLPCGRFTELLQSVLSVSGGRQRPDLIRNKDISSWTDTGGWSSSLSSLAMTGVINERVCLSMQSDTIH